MMKDEIDLKLLTAPFPAEDIEWRTQRSGIGKDGSGWVSAIAYIDNRAVMKRLDDVCGPENWKDEYDTSPVGGVLCGISIRINGEWVTKWDGADVTDIEPIKGGLSNAEKRAAVKWGIGRYLYRLESKYVKVSQTKGDDGNFIKIWKPGADRKKDAAAITGYWYPPELPSWAQPVDIDGAKTYGERVTSPLQKSPTNGATPVRQVQINTIRELCDKLMMNTTSRDLWISTSVKTSEQAVQAIEALKQRIEDKAAEIAK